MVAPHEGPGPGEVIGQYRLESLLGKGGMGTVYLATHVRLGRRVAMKVLADHLAADQVFLSRFFHEAKIVNEIRHPNIIDVIDFVETDSPRRVAYVMELVEGPSLRSVLARYQLTREQTLNAGIQLASALVAVHAIKVVHRDLKPDNVLIVGRVDGSFAEVPSLKILDFGIAKIFDREDVLETATGQVVGTPLYMAPEQIAAGPVSPATDTYAIAEILYEMATGVRVFPKDRVQALRMKLASTPPVLTPPRWPDADRFQALIQSCLSPDPSLRPGLTKVNELLTSLLRTGGSFRTTGPIRRPSLSPQEEAAKAVEPTKAERSASSGVRKALTSQAGQQVAPAESPDRPLNTLDSLALQSAVTPPSKLPVILSGAATLLAGGALVAVLLQNKGSDLPPAEVAPSTQVAESTDQKPRVAEKADPPPPPNVKPLPAIANPVAENPAPNKPVEAPPPSKPLDKPASEVVSRTPEKKDIKVRLSSRPAGAEVVDVDSGESLGTTPLSVPAQHRVRLELEGHSPVTLMVDSKSPEKLVELKPTSGEAVVKKKKLNPW